MSELKACPTPWCDSIFGPPVLKEEQFSAYIYCPTCSVETRRFPSTAEAIAAWNTRPTPTGEPVADRTNHCTGCKDRQDRIDVLEAQLAHVIAAGDELADMLMANADATEHAGLPEQAAPINKALAAWSAANGH